MQIYIRFLNIYRCRIQRFFSDCRNVSKGSRSASVFEILIISATLFSLPLFEAPKNILSVLFLLVWIIQAARTSSIGLPCVFNLPIWGLLIVLWVAPLFSSYGDVITPLNSAPRWTLLALFVIAASRLNYSNSHILIVFVALMLGGVFAVVESFWVWHFNGKTYPEFRSVGHVNHSSMYSLITLAVALGALYFRDAWVRGLASAAIISTLVYLPPSMSITGGAAITVMLTLAASVFVLRRGKGHVGVVVALVCVPLVVMPVGFVANDGFRAELVERFTGDNVFSGRDKIMNSALAVWHLHPFLGTGWQSFGVATSEDAVREALEIDGMLYSPDVYWHFSHGHNLWTTILVERGLFGFVMVTVLLYLYLKVFTSIVWKYSLGDPTVLGAALAALLVTVSFIIAGLGNTTMMNEHGHAGMAVIAVVYGYLRNNRTAQTVVNRRSLWLRCLLSFRTSLS